MYASDLKHPQQTLEDKLHALYNLNRGKRMELAFRKPYIDLLQKFGNPQQNLPPTIHVAGTNGKGSTITMLRAIYEAAGYLVHAYTSPHLHKFNERIVLAGQEIDDTTLENLIDEALRLNEGNDITFFEITTAIAFAAFSRTPADILLLEVGLGGRLDCTNIIPTAAASIITTIAYDHMEFLGDTLEAIASEKCGIMKPGTPVIIGPQNIDISVFQKFAESQNSPLFACGSHWRTDPHAEGFTFEFQNGPTSYKNPALPGLHQISNAGSVLAAIEIMQPIRPVSSDHIHAGLQTARWPGRLQNVTENFKDIIPKGWNVIYDGGHNENAAHALATHIQTLNQDVHLVVGMMAHKDPAAFLKPLLPHIKSLTLTDMPGEPHALTASDLQKSLNTQAKLSISVKSAIQDIAQNNPPAQILITGSLYLAAHIPAATK